MRKLSLPFTVLKRITCTGYRTAMTIKVATAPTVHGIETRTYLPKLLNHLKLQQCLPFTVLKRFINHLRQVNCKLQQHLPFTVLNPFNIRTSGVNEYARCNSTYYSRYAPKGARQQRSRATMRPTHCKCLNEVKAKQNNTKRRTVFLYIYKNTVLFHSFFDYLIWGSIHIIGLFIY